MGISRKFSRRGIFWKAKPTNLSLNQTPLNHFSFQMWNCKAGDIHPWEKKFCVATDCNHMSANLLRFPKKSRLCFCLASKKSGCPIYFKLFTLSRQLTRKKKLANQSKISCKQLYFITTIVRGTLLYLHITYVTYTNTLFPLAITSTECLKNRLLLSGQRLCTLSWTVFVIWNPFKSRMKMPSSNRNTHLF